MDEADMGNGSWGSREKDEEAFAWSHLRTIRLRDAGQAEGKV